MKKLLINIFTLTIITMLFILTGCKKTNNYQTLKKEYYNYLDTISYVMVEYNAKTIKSTTVEDELNKVKDILLDIEYMFSSQQTLWMKNNDVEKSTLMIVNENSGIKPTIVSNEFINVLKEAIQIATITNGGFDPTIGPLSSLWDISNKAEYCFIEDDNLIDNCKTPSKENIEIAKFLVDYKKIVINEELSTVFLTEPNMKLDLGAIAKGYAADKVLESINNNNYSYINVNLGGNVITSGKAYTYNKKDLTKNDIVPIGIENPYYQKYKSATVLSVYKENITVVASGVSKRYFIGYDEETKQYGRYHHILNSQTGYPFDNEIETITIIGPSSMKADGISTGIFALGLNAGIAKIKELEGYNAIFITKDYRIFIVGDIDYQLTKDVEKYFTIERV